MRHARPRLLFAASLVTCILGSACSDSQTESITGSDGIPLSRLDKSAGFTSVGWTQNQTIHMSASISGYEDEIETVAQAWNGAFGGYVNIVPGYSSSGTNVVIGVTLGGGSKWCGGGGDVWQCTVGRSGGELAALMTHEVGHEIGFLQDFPENEWLGTVGCIMNPAGDLSVTPCAAEKEMIKRVYVGSRTEFPIVHLPIITGVRDITDKSMATSSQQVVCPVYSGNNRLQSDEYGYAVTTVKPLSSSFLWEVLSGSQYVSLTPSNGDCVSISTSSSSGIATVRFTLYGTGADSSVVEFPSPVTEGFTVTVGTPAPAVVSFGDTAATSGLNSRIYAAGNSVTTGFRYWESSNSNETWQGAAVGDISGNPVNFASGAYGAWGEGVTVYYRLVPLGASSAQGSPVYGSYTVPTSPEQDPYEVMYTDTEVGKYCIFGWATGSGWYTEGFLVGQPGSPNDTFSASSFTAAQVACKYWAGTPID